MTPKQAKDKIAGILHSGDWRESAWDEADCDERRHWRTLAQRLIDERQEVLELLDEAIR